MSVSLRSTFCNRHFSFRYLQGFAYASLQQAQLSHNEHAMLCVKYMQPQPTLLMTLRIHPPAYCREHGLQCRMDTSNASQPQTSRSVENCNFVRTPPAFGAPDEDDSIGISKPESMRYCVALFSWFYVLPFFVQYQLVMDGWTDRHRMTAYTVLAKLCVGKNNSNNKSIAL